MNKEISLVFDIDDTLYSQMEPLLTACEFSLGRALLDPELFYRIYGYPFYPGTGGSFSGKI